METSASLLERLRTAPDETAWRRLDDLYRPLIRRWLRRDPSLGDEAEDITQDVMAVLVRELPRVRAAADRLPSALAAHHHREPPGRPLPHP